MTPKPKLMFDLGLVDSVELDTYTLSIKFEMTENGLFMKGQMVAQILIDIGFLDEPQ